MGEVELDALYVGVDRTGILYILPIEAKSRAETEMIGRIQIAQMVSLVRQDFPNLQPRILAKTCPMEPLVLRSSVPTRTPTNWA